MYFNSLLILHIVCKDFCVPHLCSVIKLCLILCNPLDYNPPGSSVHGISQKEYWSGLPFPPAEDLLDQGIKLMSPAWQLDFSLLHHLGSPYKDWTRTYPSNDSNSF